MALVLGAPMSLAFVYNGRPMPRPPPSASMGTSLEPPPTGQMPPPPAFDVRNMPGVSAPLGFFDPVGFSSGASEGKVKFYREVELKHGRVAMLASVGFLLSEFTNPLPSYIAFDESPMSLPGLILLAFIPEVLSVFTFNSPFGGEMWSMRSDYAAGDFGFDPLGLKPTSPAEFKEMQTKELNNGRLAMIAWVGMAGQELATGSKLFGN